jgi:GWxTD domain-containing protein
MLIAAVLAAALASQQAPAPGGIQMRAVRFWLPEAHKTSVLTMVEVPYSLTTPVGSGPDAYLAYQVVVRVKDDSGKILDADRWTKHASASLRSDNASAIEQMSFGVLPGQYWVQVEVTDSATGRVTADSVHFDGYMQSPGASDLLLANRIRVVPTGDTALDPGEIARGNYRFVTSPQVHVDVSQPEVGFLMEAYSPDSTSATLTLKVAMADGKEIATLVPVQKSIPAGGGVIASQFSVEGLPAGSYLIKAALAVNGQTIDRQASFVVNAVEPSLQREIAVNNASRGLDEPYFNSMTEDSLDAAAEELQILPDVNRRDLEPYKRDELSLAAKRRFLIEFWAKRDINKATPENEARIAFYNAIGYANAHYSVRYVPGWKTARGRVFAKFGAPSDSLTDNMGGQSKVRYLVWRITRSKDRWFIFGDRDNNGNYVLLRSNETTEPGTPGWRELIDPESVMNIASWLGLPRAYFNNDN